MLTKNIFCLLQKSVILECSVPEAREPVKFSKFFCIFFLSDITLSEKIKMLPNPLLYSINSFNYYNRRSSNLLLWNMNAQPAHKRPIWEVLDKKSLLLLTLKERRSKTKLDIMCKEYKAIWKLLDNYTDKIGLWGYDQLFAFIWCGFLF